MSQKKTGPGRVGADARTQGNRCPGSLTTPGIEFAQPEFSAICTRVNITDLLDRERIFRFVRFATVGGGVAVIDFGGLAIFSRFFAPLIAVTFAYFIAVTCHFLLNKFWVFRCGRKDYGKQLIQYAGVILNNWVITIVVVQICLSTFTSNVLIAKLCAIPCATICNFLLMQMVVFRTHREEESAERLPYASSMAELD